MLKGVTAGFLGLAAGLVGFAPIDGLQRYTLGILELKGGFELLPLIMGLFAISQLLIEILGDSKSQDIDLKAKALLSHLRRSSRTGGTFFGHHLLGLPLVFYPDLVVVHRT